MKLILLLLLAGCATTPSPVVSNDICYTPAEHAALGKAYIAARQYGDDMDEELRKARKFRQSIEALKGYCS